VVSRVYFLTYFIYFRLEGLFKKDFKSSGSTKSINTQNRRSGQAFVRG
jgi:hypothetical protein